MPKFRDDHVVRVVLPLGTGAVSTQTKLIGFAPFKGKVKEIRFGGQGAVTGTSITAEVQKVSADGNSTTSLQSAATDVKLTASTDETKLAAALSTVAGALEVAKDALLQVVITCNAITAGPGDFVAEVVLEPRA